MTLHCKLCGSHTLAAIIPLGELPLANSLLPHPNAQEKRYNLEVMLCQNCGLAQLKDLIDPKDLFSEYVYFSSNSDTMIESVSKLVNKIEPTLPNDALVIEIASNDGYLLKNYKRVKILGIDPAQNIAKIANEKEIPTLCAFFSKELASELALQDKKADVIHANNVMAHVPNVQGFVEGIKILLKEQAVAIIEVPYFLDLVKNLEFDTIYHEHVYYFSLKSLQLLFKMSGLEIFDIEKLSLHGGSLRIFASHEGVYTPQPIVDSILQEEKKAGLFDISTYDSFMRKLKVLRDDLLSCLKDLKARGARIAAYGASAKGTTLLNYFGIDGRFLDFVVDRSISKQGQYTPGTHLPILSPQELKNVNYALLLSWNFTDEILRQQHEFIAHGGQFILPLPEVRIMP